MVEETEEKEEETPPEEEGDAGRRFSFAMPFENTVAALLEAKPDRPPRRGRKKEAPPEGGAGEGDQT